MIHYTYSIIIATISFTVPSGYPQNVGYTLLSSRALILHWDPPHNEEQNGIIVNYTISQSPLNVMYEVDSNSTSLTLHQLSPYTPYIWVIAASTRVGRGPFSTTLNVLTPEDGM